MVVARYSAGDPAVLGRPRHEKGLTVPYDIVEQSYWPYQRPPSLRVTSHQLHFKYLILIF
jgi:hypothetical protein